MDRCPHHKNKNWLPLVQSLSKEVKDLVGMEVELLFLLEMACPVWRETHWWCIEGKLALMTVLVPVL